jgi:hypothetical protein
MEVINDEQKTTDIIFKRIYDIDDNHQLSVICSDVINYEPKIKFLCTIMNYIIEYDDDFKNNSCKQFTFEVNPVIESFKVDLLITGLDLVIEYDIDRPIINYKDNILYGYGYDIIKFDKYSNIVSFLSNLMKKIETRKLMYKLDVYENLFTHGDLYNIVETHKKITIAEEEYEKCREDYILNVLRENSADMISEELLRKFIRYANKDNMYIFPSNYVLKYVKCPLKDIKNGIGMKKIRKTLNKFSKINGDVYYIADNDELMLNCSGFKLFGMKTTYEYGYIIAIWYEKIERLCYELIENERKTSYHERRTLRENIKHVYNFAVKQTLDNKTTSSEKNNEIDKQSTEINNNVIPNIDELPFILQQISVKLFGESVIDDIPELVYEKGFTSIDEIEKLYKVHRIRNDISYDITFDSLLDKIKSKTNFQHLDQDVLKNIIVNTKIVYKENDQLIDQIMSKKYDDSSSEESSDED